MQDRSITVREIATELGLSIASVHSILTEDLDMRRAIAKFFHQDNAHYAHVIQDFLAEHNIPVVRQAPYSPDMAPCDFWLFPRLKMTLKGTRFEPREEIIQNATKQLNIIPIIAFQECFQKWQKRRGKCVHVHGDYFEADLNFRPPNQ
jgi:hypothetical protein